MKKVCLISLLMVLCSLSGCTDTDLGAEEVPIVGPGEIEPEPVDEEPEPVDEEPPRVEFNWSADGFVPQKIGDCDTSKISELGVQQASSLSSGKLQIEPSIVFLDETFTVTYRSMFGEGPWGVENTGIPEWLGFLIENESGPHDLFDDGMQWFRF